MHHTVAFYRGCSNILSRSCEACRISVAIVYARGGIRGLQAPVGEVLGFGRYELSSPSVFCRLLLLFWTTEVMVENVGIFLIDLFTGLEEVVFGFVIIVIPDEWKLGN